MAVVNIRGANGSGKSTVIHTLLGKDHRNVVGEVALAEYHTPAGKPRNVVGYKLKSGVIVVGPYRTQCGGCDSIPTQDLVCESVRRAAAMSTQVIFEGVLVSTLHSRYRDLARESLMRRRGFVFAYLSTPLEECLRRIYARNGGKPIKEELVGDKVRSIAGTRDKFAADRLTVVDLPYKSAAGTVRKVRKLLQS